MPDFEEKQLSEELAKLLKQYPTFKQLSDKQKKERIEYNEKYRRRQNIFIEYKNDFSKKIITLLTDVCQELNIPVSSTFIYAIENVDNPKRIIDKIAEDNKKEFTSPYNENYPRAGQKNNHFYSLTWYSLVNTLSIEISAHSVTIDTLIRQYKPKELSSIEQVSGDKATESTSYSEESIKLQELARKLRKEAKHILETCPLPNEEDPTATRMDLFNIYRIRGFLLTLRDNQERYRYLLTIKDIYLEMSEERSTPPDWLDIPIDIPPRFLHRVEKEISRYEKILGLPINTSIPETPETTEKKSKKLSAAKEVLAVRYFLQFINAKNIDMTVIARLITVLNGGVNYKDIYDKVCDNGL